MRITNKAIMDHYNRGLNKALNRYAKAQDRVLTGRNFNEVSEDPAAAVRAFRLRSQFRKNAGQLGSIRDLLASPKGTSNLPLGLSEH